MRPEIENTIDRVKYLKPSRLAVGAVFSGATIGGVIGGWYGMAAGGLVGIVSGEVTERYFQRQERKVSPPVDPFDKNQNK